MLCGDAAGTVDPITGEGIAYAMQTGAFAASAIDRASTGLCANALDEYLLRYDEVVSDIRSANRWRRLIFLRPISYLFPYAFADAGTLQRGYLDILAGNHGYDALPRLFVLQAKRGLRKLAHKVVAGISLKNKG